MTLSPTPSRAETALLDATRQFRRAFAFFFVAPLTMAVVGVLLGISVARFPTQPAFALGFCVALLVAACAGVPGIVLGRRALRATEWVRLESDPTEAATGGRARRSALWAHRLGVLASIAGILWTPIVAWIVVGVMGGAPGRPFRRKGQVKVPEVEKGRSWSALIPVVPALAPSERRRRAERWLADARSEHASIASFCRVALDLLALGAPPSLLEQTLHAAQDEVAHARLAYELASAFAEEPLSAGPLRAAAEGSSASRLELAASSLLDGWVNEGVAARRAREAARAADNPAEREALERIALDEARHASLGHSLAAWALRTPVARPKRTPDEPKRLDLVR
jgi:hypothetical protein